MPIKMFVSGVCIHFSGAMQKKCDAGVVYADLVGTDPGWGKRLPCNRKWGSPVVCSRAEYPSEDQCRESEEATKKDVWATITALGLCIEDSENKGWRKGLNIEGTIQCPVCRGTIRYHRSWYNGHVWLACETPGCVQAMQ